MVLIEPMVLGTVLKTPNNMVNSEKGFTLIELLVSISIVAILSVIGLVAYSTVLKNGRDAKRQSDMRQVQAALEQYYSDQLYYPCTFTFNAGFTSSIGNCSATAPTTVKTYMNTSPSEVVSGRNAYSYAATPAGCNNTTSKCIGYCVMSDMENTSPATGCATGDYDFGVSPP